MNEEPTYSRQVFLRQLSTDVAVCVFFLSKVRGQALVNIYGIKFCAKGAKHSTKTKSFDGKKEMEGGRRERERRPGGGGGGGCH